MSNQATHYWEYQLRDEDCDCEQGSEEEDDDGAPLPPHRYVKSYLSQFKFCFYKIAS